MAHGSLLCWIMEHVEINGIDGLIDFNYTTVGSLHGLTWKHVPNQIPDSRMYRAPIHFTIEADHFKPAGYKEEICVICWGGKTIEYLIPLPLLPSPWARTQGTEHWGDPYWAWPYYRAVISHRSPCCWAYIPAPSSLTLVVFLKTSVLWLSPSQLSSSQPRSYFRQHCAVSLPRAYETLLWDSSPDSLFPVPPHTGKHSRADGFFGKSWGEEKKSSQAGPLMHGFISTGPLECVGLGVFFCGSGSFPFFFFFSPEILPSQLLLSWRFAFTSLSSELTLRTTLSPNKSVTMRTAPYLAGHAKLLNAI